MMNPPRLWALAIAGMQTSLNKEDPALLGGGHPSPQAAADRQRVLARDWDAGDRQKVLGTLSWLASQGHRQAYNEVCIAEAQIPEDMSVEEAADDDDEIAAQLAFVRRHRARIGAKSLLAWDGARLVTVAGWAHLAGMISEDEAWSYILPMAYAVQWTYASWEEYGQHHLLGYEFWAGSWDGAFARCYLAMGHDPQSPWRNLPWRMDLSAHGLMAPLQNIARLEPPAPGRAR